MKKGLVFLLLILMMIGLVAATFAEAPDHSGTGKVGAASGYAAVIAPQKK